jgi:hypothetical protein
MDAAKAACSTSMHRADVARRTRELILAPLAHLARQPWEAPGKAVTRKNADRIAPVALSLGTKVGKAGFENNADDPRALSRGRPLRSQSSNQQRGPLRGILKTPPVSSRSNLSLKERPILRGRT